ncbi:hypothetical protein HK405_016063, partial [Cladochytrium tenue]
MLRALAQVSAYVPLGLVIRTVRLVPACVPKLLWKRTPSGAISPCRIDIRSGAMVQDNRVARESSTSTSQLVEYYVVFPEKELFQLAEGKSVTPGDMMVMKHPSLFSLRDCLKFVAKHGADEKPAGLLPGNGTKKLDCLVKDDPQYHVDEVKRNTEVYPSVTDPLDRSTPWIISGVPLLFDVGDRFAPEAHAKRSYKTALDLLPTIRPAQDSLNGLTSSNFLAIAIPDLYATPLEDIFCIFFTAFKGAFSTASRELVFKSSPNQGVGGGRAPGATPTSAPANFEVVVHTSDAVPAASAGTTALVASAFLQMVAARAAGIHKLVYHLSDQPPAVAQV